MKKITLSLAVLLSTLSSSSFAQSHSPFNVNVYPNNGGIIFGLAGLYLRPSTSELDYALVFPNDNNVNGKFHNVDMNYNWGYQIKLGYLFPGTANDILLTYTALKTDDKDHINNLTDGNKILGTLAPAEFVVNNFTNASADAKSSFDYKAVDLDASQHVNVGCRTQFKFFGGLRYADIKHNLDANYYGNEIIPGARNSFQFNSSQKSHFHGVGPRFGVDANYYLGYGFGIVGETAAALLVGNVDSDFNLDYHRINSITNSQDEFNISYHHPSETRVVPNVTGKLGANYVYNFCNRNSTQLVLEAGYQADHYFNSIDRLNFIDTNTPEQNMRHSMDASFTGPYVALKVKV